MKKETKKEIVVAPATENRADGFIQQAITQGLPVETMERLFVLHREIKADIAREAFVKALANFQKSVPVIEKTKQVLNKDRTTIRYMYAPIDSVIKQIKNELADNGLSYTWNSERLEEHIKVICKLTHIAGHSEISSFDVPIVASEFMTRPQSYATAQSFAKRYTLLNVLGIATADEDVDATDSDKNGDAKSKKAKIIFLLRGLGHPNGTREECAKAVKDITKVELNEKNFDTIIERLQVAHDEMIEV